MITVTHVASGFSDGELIVDVEGVEDAQPVRYRTASMRPFGLGPTQPHLLDLFEFMLIFYTADRLVPRQQSRWSRAFEITFPVTDVKQWEAVRSDLEQLLWQSTGDEVRLRPFARRCTDIHCDSRAQSFAFEHEDRPRVILLSDGLDSLCGAFQAVTGPGRVAYVSLITNSRKRPRIFSVVRRLRAEHPHERILFHPIRLHLEDAPRRQERTQRSRTLLAIATGLIVATAYGSPDVTVSENGMGILNLPIPYIQMEHEASQVLHPANLALWRRVTQKLLDGATVAYPNRYKTKAQMLAELPKTVRDLIAKTSSCDAPLRRDEYADCGVCGSCFYRKLALYHAGLSRFDVKYSSKPPKAPVYAPANVLAFQARKMRVALESADPWKELIHMQPTLRNAIDATDSMERAHIAQAIIGLLSAHIGEVQAVSALAHAV